MKTCQIFLISPLLLPLPLSYLVSSERLGIDRKLFLTPSRYLLVRVTDRAELVPTPGGEDVYKQVVPGSNSVLPLLKTKEQSMSCLI